MNNLPKINYAKERFIKILSDSGWKYSTSANIQKGRLDYERHIVYHDDGNRNNLSQEIERIKLLENPGFFGWKVLTVNPTKIILFTCCNGNQKGE
jgi:hypothetical protein